jgi:hypothetical protein
MAGKHKILALVAFVMAPMLAGQSAAAVRVCGNVISSAIATGKDEMEAKKKALDDWRAKTAVYGADLDLWRLAANKALQCYQKNGLYECVALGAPCTIQNNPRQRPSGPDRKGQSL